MNTLAFSGAAYSGGINIDFDSTMTLQMVAFMLLVVAMKPLLFDPMLKVFEERELRTDGAREEARRMQQKAGDLLKRYEAELQRVNQAAAEERDKIRTETAKVEAEILAEARAAAGKIVERGRADIDKQVAELRFELGRRAEQLSHDVASKTLGREV